MEESKTANVAGVATSGLTEKKVVVYLNQRNGWSALPPELRGDITKELGASFLPAPSKSVCRGLDPHLEQLLLPAYIGVNASSQDFPAKASEYWNNWGLVVREEGTILDISTYKKTIDDAFNEGKKIEVDYPVVPDDYISYNMIMQNPTVAKTKEDLENLSNWDYYIVDLGEKKKEELKTYELLNQATIQYAKIMADGEQGKEKMLQILEMTKESGEFFSKENSITELGMALLKKVQMPLQKNSKGDFYHPFVKYATDENLKNKSFISRCLNAGVLTKEGNTYFNGEESLGNLKEVLAKFNEKTFAGEYLKLQTRLEGTES